MSKHILPQYTQDFAPGKEMDVAGQIDKTAGQIFENMQGHAIEVAIDAMQMAITRYNRGDHSITLDQALRVAREIRALMHEKSALYRQCRAEAIEMLGLRPRAPISDSRPAHGPAATRAAADIPGTDKQKPQVVETIVKTTEPQTTTTPAKLGQRSQPEPADVA